MYTYNGDQVAEDAASVKRADVAQLPAFVRKPMRARGKIAVRAPARNAVAETSALENAVTMPGSSALFDFKPRRLASSFRFFRIHTSTVAFRLPFY